MRRLKTNDAEWLWTELAHAVGRDAPLPEALKDLALAEGETRRGEAADYLARAISDGMTLAQAVSEREDVFGRGAGGSLQAGEESGRLCEVLEGLAETTRSSRSFRREISSAIAYPVAIALAAFALIVLINVRISPALAGIAIELDVHVPDAVKQLPLFVQVESFCLLFGPAIALIVLYLIPGGRLPFQYVLDDLRLRAPLTGGFLRKFLLARWCGYAGMLFRAGVPAPRAVRLAGRSTGNLSVEEMTRDVAQRVEQGMSLPDAMDGEGFFPPTLAWMLRSSEAAGGDAHVWSVAEDMYAAAARWSSLIVSVVLRLLFAVLAFQVVGATVYSMMAPLISLMNSIGG